MRDEKLSRERKVRELAHQIGKRPTVFGALFHEKEKFYNDTVSQKNSQEFSQSQQLLQQSVNWSVNSRKEELVSNRQIVEAGNEYQNDYL